MAIETLRPNGAGDETAIDAQYPVTGSHWEKVDEAVADDAATTVSTDSSTWQRDLYNLPSHSVGTGTINKITVCFRFMQDASVGHYCKASIKSNSTITDGSTHYNESGDIWYVFSEEWSTNPADGQAWEWNDIDALQIGVSLFGYEDPSYLSHCTQVYVEVDYTPSAAVPRHAFINFQGPGIF